MQYDFGNYMGNLPEDAHSPVESVGATRKLIEEVARESVAALQNVTVRAGSWVSGLKLADAHGAIQGRLPFLFLAHPRHDQYLMGLLQVLPLDTYLERFWA